MSGSFVPGKSYIISRRWQVPGAVKKEKKIEKKSEKNPKKNQKNRASAYMFLSTQAKIKPCSHQLNYMKFLL